MKEIKYCLKRNGHIELFNKTRIINAINLAFTESGQGNRNIASKITETVIERLLRLFPNDIPSIEDIQDIVEDTLMMYNYRSTAKKYIEYRYQRNAERDSEILV